MPAPDPHRVATLIVELRRSLRRSAGSSVADAATPQRGRPSAGPRSGSAHGSGATSPRLTRAEEEGLRYVAADPWRGTSAIATALRLRAKSDSAAGSARSRDGGRV